jgi:putative glycosyltransferase (TIGR04372 family)
LVALALPVVPLTGRGLTFREIIKSGLGRATSSQDHERAGVDVVDKTPEEIAALVAEMDERMKGTWQETDEDRDLQTGFE